MKSQIIRAFVLLALIAVAHQMKPFNSVNLLTFVGASVSSLSQLLPANAVNKVSVLTAVIARSWQTSDGLALPATNLLAVNHPMDVAACAGEKLKRRVRTVKALPIRVSAPAAKITSEALEAVNEPIISWQNDTAEEASAMEKMALPLPIEMPDAAAAPAGSTIMPTLKRDACELPAQAAPMTEALPEAKPMNEGETEPSVKPMRAGRPSRALEIEPFEIQPIVFPRKPSHLPALSAAQKNVSKC
jgi:hypothetical protein